MTLVCTNRGLLDIKIELTITTDTNSFLNINDAQKILKLNSSCLDVRIHLCPEIIHEVFQENFDKYKQYTNFLGEKLIIDSPALNKDGIYCIKGNQIDNEDYKSSLEMFKKRKEIAIGHIPRVKECFEAKKVDLAKMCLPHEKKFLDKRREIDLEAIVRLKKVLISNIGPNIPSDELSQQELEIWASIYAATMKKGKCDNKGSFIIDSMIFARACISRVTYFVTNESYQKDGSLCNLIKTSIDSGIFPNVHLPEILTKKEFEKKVGIFND